MAQLTIMQIREINEWIYELSVRKPDVHMNSMSVQSDHSFCHLLLG